MGSLKEDAEGGHELLVSVLLENGFRVKNTTTKSSAQVKQGLWSDDRFEISRQDNGPKSLCRLLA